jgi:hypothetical protein
MRKKNFVSPSFPYKESQFTSHDYKLLYAMATPGNDLRYRLHSSKYRDKAFQRTIHTTSEYNIFICSINDLALYINVNNSVAKDILKWRLYLNK